MLALVQKARNKEIGIWKKSSNYGCLDLIELKYEEDERCTDDEKLVVYNRCDEIKGVLKDDATHIYDVKIGNVFSKDFS